MITMRNLTMLILGILLLVTPAIGQSLEEDNMVLFAKANVLYESERYDEAVRMYNRILRDDENHTGALFMRAKSKYELGAYKGTKNDILLFIEKVGITKKVVHLMAETEMNLSNNDAASNYIKTALELDPYDGNIQFLAGEIAIARDHRSDACEAFASASQMGHEKARLMMREYCGEEMRNTSSDVANNEEEITSASDTGLSDEVEVSDKDDDGIVSLEEIVKEAEDDPEISNRPDPNATSEVTIDDKLTVALTNGVGHREVTSRPSIFMLSDQDGTVVIDMCIDSNGSVTEAEFNRDDSTIFRSSLTSLALRKAKSFQFAPSSREDCGVMVFYIKS